MVAGESHRVRHARRRLKLAHRRLGSWQRVAEEEGVNVRHVHGLATKGIVPKNARVAAVLLEAKGTTEKLTPDQAMLVHILQEHPGKSNAQKLWDLVRRLFGSAAAENPTNNNLAGRKTRAMIEAINHDHDGLICSDPFAGYWWAANLDEGIEAADKARGRAIKQMDNANQLERNAKKVYGGQLGLFGKDGGQ